MYRRERYFDKNDRAQNLYGQEKEFKTKDKWDDDDEITLVLDEREKKSAAEEAKSP